MIKRKLSKGAWNSSIYGMAMVFDKVLAFICIPIFTRLLTPEEYGNVSTYLSWVTIVSVFISFSLGNSVRGAFVDLKNEINEYISSIVFLEIIISILVGTLVFPFFNLFFSQNNITPFILCITQSAMSNIIVVYNTKYMMKMDGLKKALLSSGLNAFIVILSLLFLFLKWGKGDIARELAYTLGNLIIGCAYTYFAFRQGKTFFSLRYWKYGLRYSLPLMVHSFSVIALSSSDRIMLTQFKGAEETAFYSLAYSLSMVMLSVTTIFENIWIPWFTNKMMQEKVVEINEKAFKFIKIITLFISIFMLCAPEILKIMTDEKFWSCIYLIPPITLSGLLIFLYSINVDLEYYYKETGTIASSTTIAALSNIGLNFLFIPIYGGFAAAFTTLFSYGILMILHYRASHKIDKRLFPIQIYICSVVFSAVIAVLTYIFMDNIIVRFSGMFFLVIYTMFYIKKELFSEIIGG